MGIIAWVIEIGGLVALILYEVWVTILKKRVKGAKNPSETLSAIQWGNGIIILL